MEGNRTIEEDTALPTITATALLNAVTVKATAPPNTMRPQGSFCAHEDVGPMSLKTRGIIRGPLVLVL